MNCVALWYLYDFTLFKANKERNKGVVCFLFPLIHFRPNFGLFSQNLKINR
jgi:hypothetical protein